MFKKKSIFKAALLGSTLLSIAVTEVAAQGIQEIVVTARKREESLQAVPLTVTAFTAESIQRQGIRTVNDIAKLTPGLSFDKGFAPQDTRPNIRGLPTTRGRPPVGILLDGIDISSESIATAGGSQLMNLKLVDVERIEVVKGPQSALYGRVAFGGAINYVSKRPNLETQEGSINLDIATHDLYEARGAISAPIIENKLAIRVNALYSNFDGFYKNTVTDNTIGGWETYGAALAVRFKPVENADFTLRLSYSDEKSEARPSYYFGGAGLVVAGRNQTLSLPANAVGLRLGNPANPNAPLPATIPYPRVGELRAGEPVQLSVDPFTGKDFEAGRLKPFIASLIGDVEFDGFTVSSWTGLTLARALSRADAEFYGRTPTNVTLPSPGVAEPLNALSITDLKTFARQISQEIRIGNLDEGRFRWAVGGLYWQEDYKSLNGSVFINGFARFQFPGWSAARELQQRGRPPYEPNERNTKHYSGYAMAEFDITQQLELSAEARYSHEKFDYLFGRTLLLPLSATGQITANYAFTGTPFRPASSTNMFTPRVTVNYKVTDDALVYASWSKGEKPAGFLNVAVVLDPNDAFYNPEKLYNYEAGFKTSWLDDRVRFNGAYFHMVYKDRLTQILVPDARSPQGTNTLTRNQGEAKVDGVELEATVAPVEGLTLSAAYTYLNPRFTDSEVPNTSALGIAGSGNCRVGTVGPQVVCFTNTNGNQLEQSAKHAFTGTINYVYNLANDWDLTTELSAQYRSKRYLSPDNLTWTPAYWNFDLRIGVQNERISIIGYVDNLFNDDKIKSAQSYGDPFIAPPFAPPVLAYTTYAPDKRQFGVRLGYKF
jgi:outer membrane receptor protein involved in Fe transport